MSKSDHLLDLTSHLALIEQQTLFRSDTLKYSSSAIKEIKLALSARNYVNLTWELSHLLWVLQHTEGDANALHFFFVDESVSSQSARNWFANVDFVSFDAHSVSVGSQGIMLSLREHAFTVNWTRINALSGLMELILVLMPDIWERINALFGKGLNSIKILASDMQKALYDWTEAFMPSVRTHKKYVALAQQFSSFERHHIDDNFIVVWTRLHNLEGFSKLNNYYSSLCAFLAAVDEDKKIEYGNEDAVNTVSDEQSVYHFISSYANSCLLQLLPAKPKVLSQLQQRKLASVFNNAQYATKLPWASLAVLSFNQTQAQLVQAMRASESTAFKQRLLTDVENYATQIAFLMGLKQLNEQTMLSCLYVLHTKQSALLVDAIAENTLWLTTIKSGDENNTQITEGKVSIEQVNHAAASLFDTANEAARKVKRVGFTKASMLDDDSVYLALIRLLVQMNSVIDSLCRIASNSVALEEKYLSDCSIVNSVFKQRYME